MKLLDKWPIKYGFMVIILALIIYDFYYIPNTLKHEHEQLTAQECPGQRYVDVVGKKWSEEYWIEMPNASVQQWTYEWNRIMRAMKCDKYTLTPEEAYERFQTNGQLP